MLNRVLPSYIENHKIYCFFRSAIPVQSAAFDSQLSKNIFQLNITERYSSLS